MATLRTLLQREVSSSQKCVASSEDRSSEELYDGKPKGISTAQRVSNKSFQDMHSNSALCKRTNKKLATRREKVANSPFEMEEERRCWNVAIRLKVLHQKTFLAVSNGIYNQEILKTVWAPFSNPIRDWIFSSSNNRWWIPKNSEPFRLSYLSFSELKQNSPLRSIRNHSMNIKVTATEMHQTNPWVFPFEAVEDGDSPANANVDHSESIRNALLSRHWPTATGPVHCSADGVSMLLANALFG